MHNIEKQPNTIPLHVDPTKSSAVAAILAARP